MSQQPNQLTAGVLRLPAKRSLAWLAVLAFWLVIVLLVDPRGDFPLNDDWNYARSVKSLVESGTLTVTVWTLAASLTHILIGWAACLLTGFSFETLRLSTLAMGLLALVCLYLMLSSVARPSYWHWLAVLVLMTNPLFFELSHTYMTDVPFVALATLTGVVLARQLSPAGGGWLAPAGASAAVVALCLTRQVGLVMPVAFAVARLSRGGRSGPELVRALLPLVCGVVAVAVFQLWLREHAGVLFSYKVEEAFLKQHFAQGPWHLLVYGLTNFVRSLVYLGLFLLPFLVAVCPAFWGNLNRRERWFAAALAVETLVLLLALLLGAGSLMPLGDNILFDLGLGPILLTPRAVAGAWPAAPRSFWLAITVAGAAGAALLLAAASVAALRLRKRAREKTPAYADGPIAFYFLTVGLYMLVICVRGFFDRYLIFPLPFLMAMVVSTIPPPDLKGPRQRLAATVAAALIFCLAAFSVAGTHDYLALNRARWRALDSLVAGGRISPMKIDGGLEFNGWYAYENPEDGSAVVFDPMMTHGDDYIVSLVPVAGYEQVSRFPFRRWLDGGEAAVLALRKNTRTSGGDGAARCDKPAGGS